MREWLFHILAGYMNYPMLICIHDESIDYNEETLADYEAQDSAENFYLFRCVAGRLPYPFYYTDQDNYTHFVKDLDGLNVIFDKVVAVNASSIVGGIKRGEMNYTWK